MLKPWPVWSHVINLHAKIIKKVSEVCTSPIKLSFIPNHCDYWERFSIIIDETPLFYWFKIKKLIGGIIQSEFLAAFDAIGRYILQEFVEFFRFFVFIKDFGRANFLNLDLVVFAGVLTIEGIDGITTIVSTIRMEINPKPITVFFRHFTEFFINHVEFPFRAIAD